MATTERQRQQRLADKKKKRKLVAKGAAAGLALGRKPLHYCKFPIHECLMPEGLFEIGLGTVICVRRMPDGMMAITAFVVDVFCLGVKDALFKVTSEQVYEQMIKPGLIAATAGQALLPIEPACARKLVQGAVHYAEALGFSAHRDYQDAKGIFGEVDGLACTTEFAYGRAGKPFYIRGPRESLVQAERILAQLRSKCGDGGFDFLVAMDDGPLPD